MVTIEATSGKSLEEIENEGGILPSDEDQDRTIAVAQKIVRIARVLGIGSKTKRSNDKIKAIVKSMPEKVISEAGMNRITVKIPNFDLDSDEKGDDIKESLEIMAARCLNYIALAITEYQMTGDPEKFSILTTAMDKATTKSDLSSEEIMKIALSKIAEAR